MLKCAIELWQSHMGYGEIPIPVRCYAICGACCFFVKTNKDLWRAKRFCGIPKGFVGFAKRFVSNQ